MDPIAQFKEMQAKVWGHFTPFEVFTGSVAPHLVKFSGITPGARVLDVGCGTGVVGLTAARLGAKVTGIDLSPELIERAKVNSDIAKLSVNWHVGDAEQLPFKDGEFDFVVSQFGHMFTPQPEVVTREMLRVLKKDGTIAFSTWPPEGFTGRMFALTAKFLPPPPQGVSPPTQWGDPNIIRERLGSAVRDLTFDRNVMTLLALSPQHARVYFETNVGPLIKLVQTTSTDDPAKLAQFRSEFEALLTTYFRENFVRQDFLMTRAVKA